LTEPVRSRFGAQTTAREVVEGLDLAGRTAIVTGGATGIGLETARALSEAGARVVLAVRSLRAGGRAAVDIARTGRAPVTVDALDLADLSSVSAFVERWGDHPLHILINNAGVMACPFARTADGLEMQIGTNHFGHHRLALGLVPALRAGANKGRRHARVVSLSSIAHRRSPVRFEDVNYRRRPYDRWEAYGQSKTADALFAVAFDDHFHQQGITANAVVPGGVMTPLQRHMTREEMIDFGWIDAEGRINGRFKTPAQGAATSVWAAVARELEGVGARYLENCGQAPPYDPSNPAVGVMPHAVDPEAAERLWTLSEQTTGS
jgi:NAD(P)-dependent dehydrogenase (short-subunit alcohol dehydrogenase family)